MTPVLQVGDLSVQFQGRGRPVSAIRNVSFELGRGEVVGILGESGCGKSTLAAALLQLLPASAKMGGFVRLNGRELIGLKEKEIERIRGAEISLIYQEPAMSLSPVMRVGAQLANVLRAHRDWDRHTCRRYAEKLIAEVGLADSSRIYDSYPHQLSSGQKQRIVIAQAIACEPAIVIADEPTANLDADMQAQVVSVFEEMRARLGLGILFITHNPAVLSRFADRIIVMYAGQIVEHGPARDIFENPLHPYTAALLRAVPGDTQPGKGNLLPIAGDPPDMAQLPNGCAFHVRCGRSMAMCATTPPEMAQAAPRRWLQCFNPGAIQ